MNLRDHAEVAALLARFLNSSHSRYHRRETAGPKDFWEHLRYLEHLWKKARDRELTQSSRANRIRLAEEIVVTGLLARTLASTFAAADPTVLSGWERHQGCALSLWNSLLFGSPEPETQVERSPSHEPCSFSIRSESGSAPLPLSTELRLERLRSRMDRWSDILNSADTASGRLISSDRRQLAHADGFASQASPFRNHRLWPLLTAGLARSVPSRRLEDPVRVAVHRQLQALALRQIPSDQFFFDGSLRPRLLAMIAAARTSG